MSPNLVAYAKISPPKLAAVLPRERLFGRLDQLRNYSMVWIGGCPGAGKTALVADYLHARKLPGLWYRMDRYDHDAKRFFTYLSAAAAGAKSPAAPTPKSEHGPQPSAWQSADGPGVSGSPFTQELFRGLPRPGVLVLDDCHEVPSDGLIHTLLVDSAAEIPQGINVVLVGRGEPPSLYSRLIASHTMGVMDSRDLKFTLEETRALAGRFSVDERVPQLLQADTEGWAAGVAMTLERLRGYESDVHSVEQQTRKAVFGYYAGEVFDRASSEDRRILVSTAMLPRVSGPRAKELTGSSRAEQFLSKLASHELFTTRSTGNFEFVPSFREFLLEQVEGTLAPGEFEETADRAASLAHECGELETVVDLIVRTGNWEALVRLLARHGTRLLAHGGAASLRKWIAQVPAAICANAPWLTYWSGAAAIGANPGAARMSLEAAWNRFEERADRVGQLLAAAAMLESYQMGLSSLASLTIWIDRLQESLNAVSIPSRETELRVYASLVFALASVRPWPEVSATCIARLKGLLDREADVNHRVFAGRSLLVAHCSAFDIDSAQEVAQQLRSMIEEKGCSEESRAAALNAIAYGLWYAGGYVDAAATLREAVLASTQIHVQVPDPLHFKSRYLIASAQGDCKEMAECIEAMRQATKSGDELGRAMLSDALARQASLRGDLAAAAGHWRTAVLQADTAGVRPMQWVSRLMLSGCCAKSGDCAGATDGLRQAWALCDEAPPEAWRRDYDLLAAYVALRRGDRTECRRLISVVFAAAAQAGKPFEVFTLLAPAMAELCMETMRCGIAVESVRDLIRRYRLPPPATADRDWPWPFKVYVLGTFRVFKGDAPLRTSRRTPKRALELLQALIAFGGNEVSAGALTDALWPDSEGDAGYHALESALYRLRQLLGEPDAVTMSGSKLTLDRSYFWVDMWAFEKELRPTGARGSDAMARLARIRQLYQGHFLANESDKPWAIDTRQALRDKLLRSIRDAARAYESERLWQEAANVYQTGIEFDKMAEDLYRGLMICHRELGDHTELTQVYRRCRDLLTRMLGVQPSSKTQAIYQSVRQYQVAEGA